MARFQEAQGMLLWGCSAALCSTYTPQTPNPKPQTPNRRMHAPAIRVKPYTSEPETPNQDPDLSFVVRVGHGAECLAGALKPETPPLSPDPHPPFPASLFQGTNFLGIQWGVGCRGRVASGLGVKV